MMTKVVYLRYLPLILLCFSQYAVALTCLQQNNPRNPHDRLQVNCSPDITTYRGGVGFSDTTEAATNNRSMSLTFQGLFSPVQAILEETSAPPPIAGYNATNMFQFDLNCTSELHSDVCDNINQTMYQAGQLISNVVVLTRPIVVNVTLISFCKSEELCGNRSDILSLAAAAPARTIPLIDEDGVTRLYPQAVVKQFSTRLARTPLFSQYDINLNINTDGSFYYPETGSAIQSNQSDFLLITLHELMHGIGFTSSYEDYFHQDSTPSTITPNVLLSYTAGNVAFEGFIEYAFDKYLRDRTGAFVTQSVAKMNDDLQQTVASMNFSSIESLATYIGTIPVFQSTSTSFLQNFTTALTTTFVGSSGNTTLSAFTLETSIKPFSSGSSISHVAAEMYADTQDFLMRAYCAQGVSMQHMLESLPNSNKTEVDLYGPLGPGLRTVLGTLGYKVKGGIPSYTSISHSTPTVESSALCEGPQLLKLSILWCFLLVTLIC